MISRRDLGSGLLVSGLVTGLGNGAPALAKTNTPALRPGGFAGYWQAEGQVRRAGGVLHWRSVGPRAAGAAPRPPLVLLHMLGGWSDDWREVARALGEDRRVIAFDLPGHGLSRWQGDPPEVQTVEETAALVAAALSELGIAQADFAGMSLGGCVAVALAAAMPDRVRRLVLPSCALGKGRSREDIARREADQERTGMFSKAGDPLPGTPEVLVKVFGIRNAARISAEQNASRALAGRWIRPQERGVGLTDFLVLMRRVSAPTLLIYGARDSYFPGYRPLAEASLRDRRSLVLPDASGFPVQDEPVATAAAMRAFLDA